MMERRKKSLATGKIKKKMTKEQAQMAVIKKKECDAKALTIVERLLEPDVNPVWLVENLKDINRCHMEDIIEERAIVKLCGYVLCQKPLTVVYNQRYHISLKEKKVYDITKRKNFCSSTCFSASNYLLEQMLTSPLWLRDNEEIPKFRIFRNIKQESNSSSLDIHGEEVNIAAVGNDTPENVESHNSSNKDSQLEGQLQIETEKEKSECIENFVLEAVQNFELKDMDSNIDKTSASLDNQQNIDVKLTMEINNDTIAKVTNESKVQKDKALQAHGKDKNYDLNFIFNTHQSFKNSIRKDCIKDTMLENKKKLETGMISNDEIDKNKNTCIDDNIIEQCVYPIENEISHLSSKSCSASKNYIESEDTIEQSSYPVEDRCNETCISFDLPSTHERTVVQEIESDTFCNVLTSDVTKEKKEKARKKIVDVHLAAKVEESFREWVTDQTVDYLFGDESIKKRVINTIEIQENHRILCGKLDRLQVQEEREDAELLGKTALKPAPHFSVLKEEGQKLDLKVRAFYEGKTTFEELPKSDTDEGVSDNVETFLPLTDIHAPQILRRKIFLEKLDHVLPDLLRTLAGKNDMYARTSFNYSSIRSTAVKALIHTFSLSAKNITFKTAEWTLVGLVIIKMLSLSDPYLASLLATKQANLYASMILTAYQLNSDYLNLLVTSFNPNMNPR